MGTICPNGTYGSSINLTSASQCAVCPGEHYCTDGRITGECSPGYFCRSGQDTPTPEWNALRFEDDPSGLLSFLNDKDGGQCPPGHYCPLATMNPFPCENSTFRLGTKGVGPESCGPCFAGSICHIGDPVPYPCLPGSYCPLGEGAIPCPRSHYNNN